MCMIIKKKKKKKKKKSIEIQKGKFFLREGDDPGLPLDLRHFPRFGHGVLQVAERIDQAQLLRLLAGQYAAVRDRQDRVPRKIPSLGHGVHELGGDIVDHALEELPLLRAHLPDLGTGVLEAAALDHASLPPDLLHQG